MKRRFKIVASLACLLALAGCGERSVQVTGRVTCQDKPVRGSILFSPAGDDESNTGLAVSAPLNEEGAFQLRLKTIGKHTVVITPRDVKFPVPAGQFDYPCDRSPLEKDVQAGDNDFTIDMAAQPK